MGQNHNLKMQLRQSPSPYPRNNIPNIAESHKEGLYVAKSGHLDKDEVKEGGISLPSYLRRNNGAPNE